MKIFRLSISALALMLTISVQAQTSLNTAVNFTVTDIHGQEHNLFNYLDAGKHVVVDFFTYWCGPCQAIAPQFNQAYHAYGCNQGDVIFISVEGDGTLAQTMNFETSYTGVDGPPMVAGLTAGGGDAVLNTYGITAYPTIILIAPNKNIVNKDIWPFSVSIVSNLLNSNGVSAQECVSGINDADNTLQFEVFPNPASDILNIKYSAENYNVSIYNVVGQEVVSKSALNGQQEISIASLPSGNYVVRINDGKNTGTQNLTIVR